MPRLTALTSIFGDYTGGSASGVRAGLIHASESFNATEEQAEHLESHGLAERYRPPTAPKLRFPDVSSFKQTYPPENKMMPVEAVASKQAKRR